jgi:hypothetical protein
MMTLALLSFRTGGISSITWMKTSITSDPSRNMCLGLDVDTCTSAEDCSKTYMGPCGTAAAPTLYFATYAEKLMLVINDDTATQYQTDTSKQHQVGEYVGGPASGYMDYTKSETKGSATVAYSMTGNFVKDAVAASGGYIGIANYLVTDGTMTSNTNEFYLPRDFTDAQQSRTIEAGQGTSSYGATYGPFETCIVEADGSNCGAPTSLAEGSQKFTVFGFPTGGQFSMPTGSSFCGVRTVVDLIDSAGKATTITFNGGTYTLDTIGSTQITSVEYFSDSGSMAYTFPTKYNVGTLPTDKTSTTMAAAPTQRLDITLRATKMSDSKFYLDYLFNAQASNGGTDFAADMFFAYDPSGTGSTPTPAPTAAPTSDPTTGTPTNEPTTGTPTGSPTVNTPTTEIVDLASSAATWARTSVVAVALMFVAFIATM